MNQEIKKIKNATEAFEKTLKDSPKKKYVLYLYVTGSTTRSLRAIGNIKKICEEHLKGRYDLKVVDLYQNPNPTKGEQIVVVPTLIKKLPAPVRKIFGDLSNTEVVLLGLDL